MWVVLLGQNKTKVGLKVTLSACLVPTRLSQNKTKVGLKELHLYSEQTVHHGSE